MNRSTLLGTTVTIAWIGGAVLLAVAKRSEWASMTLNSWGDFFAGAVAPLAFLWLVLGYLQQGEELRLNTEALKAQQEELRRQVEETAALAKNAERQANAAEALANQTRQEAERVAQREKLLAQPDFVSGGGSTQSDGLLLVLQNNGATVTDLVLTCPPDIRMSMAPAEILRSGQSTNVRVQSNVQYPFSFKITYTDGLKCRETQQFIMQGPFHFANAA